MISDPDAVAALRRADALHTALTHIVLEGGDLAEIAEAVGDALGCGVVFTSTDGRERAAHLDDAQRAALADGELLDPTGRVRVERIDPEGTAVGSGQALVRRVVAAGVDHARLVAERLDGTIHSTDAHALELENEGVPDGASQSVGHGGDALAVVRNLPHGRKAG